MRVMYGVQFTADRNGDDHKATKPSNIISSSRLMHFQRSTPSVFKLDIAKAWKSNYRRVYVAREPANKTRVYHTCRESAGTWRIIPMCLPTHTWSRKRRRNLKLYAISHGDNWDQREVNYPTELLLRIPKSLTRYRFGSLSVLFLFPAASRINEFGV